MARPLWIVGGESTRAPAVNCQLDLPDSASSAQTRWSSTDATNSFPPATPAETMAIGRNGPPSDIGICLDELRVSNVPRYPFTVGRPTLGGRRAFEPPTSPFEPDKDTLLLFHLDGNVEGVGPGGKRVKARRVGK